MPLAPTVAIELPPSHISITVAVSLEDVSSLIPFASHGVLPHFVGEYSILTGSLTAWEYTLTALLKKAELYLDIEWGLDACQMACGIWMLFETNGFRDVFMKYEKVPLTKGIFTI